MNSPSCPKCGAELPAGSAFCNRCGAPLGGAPAPAALPSPAPAAPEPEEEIWRGRFSGKALAHGWILWILWTAGLAYAWLALLTEKIRANPAARLALLGAAGLPLLAILWSLAVRKLSIRYRLTTHRLFRDRGILWRRADEIELIRVDDVAVRQNLIQRLFNVGTVEVISPTDPTEPRLELEGIENPFEVKERIRSQVRWRRDRSLHVESL